MKSLLHALAQRLASLLPDELRLQELWQLLTPHRHSVLLSRRRATMIVNRVRLFAFLFAVLTPLWSLVDLMVFSRPLWLTLAVCRVATCLAFVSLLVLYRPNGRLFDAYRAIAILFAIPTVFYVVSHTLLGGQQLDQFSAAVATGYAFLPFVLMAGLAIFPLTLQENLLLVVLLLLAQLLAGYLSWTTLSWPSFAGGFWLLILIAAVTALASMSQLAFMIALVRQAIQDPLTGVYSRGSGDHFKSINDRFGHEAGDQVLRELAARVKGGLRQSDSLLRWGGEEFVLVMPDTDRQQALQALHRIIKGGLGSRPDGSVLTASIGLAERRHDRPQALRELLELADQRMYRAKQTGRDRIDSGEPGEPRPE